MTKFYILLLSIFTIPFITFSQTACPPGEVEVEIDIDPDSYPGETSWELADGDGNIIATGDFNGTTLCVDASLCLVFTIFDSFGDGIYAPGGFEVLYDGVSMGSGSDDIGFEMSVEMACPDGFSCSFPEYINEGTHTAPYATNGTWYEFTAPATGTYKISTCGLGNTCNTVIWVYDNCDNLQWDHTNEATIYYNDDFCGTQAEVHVNFQGGMPYYIRIGDEAGDCMGNDIDWELSYLGPVVGCTDLAACNYEPLATVSDSSCIYPGDPDCPDGPDLVVIQDVLESSMTLDILNNNDNCYITEGCLTGYGAREIIRFTTRIENQGSQDYYIGPPDPTSNQFEWDACHGHWHQAGYAQYDLYDSLGQKMSVGFKNGFCVLDLACMWGTAQYGCSNMGISAGCADIYGSGLSCQWLDVSEVPAGKYTVVVTTNWNQTPDALGRYETDYFNNWAQVCIQLDRNPITGAASMTVLNDCQPYVDCNGQIYGSAQLDCAGDCDGPRKMGDLNIDTMQNLVDAAIYQQEILDHSLTAAPCNDLNDDGQITVTDAALVIGCYHEQIGHTHQTDLCDLPVSITNPNDTVVFSIHEVNVDYQYVDISVLNPTTKVIAYQFNMSGLTITDVEDIQGDPDYSVNLSHSDDEVLAVSYAEKAFQKHTVPTPFLRVYFDATLPTEICIDNITAIVNYNYEEVITGIGDGCLFVDVPNGIVENLNKLRVKVAPNPFGNTTKLTFNNPTGQVYRLEIIDIAGEVVKQHTDIQGNEVIIEKENMAPGVYMFRLSGGQTVMGKLVVQ